MTPDREKLESEIKDLESTLKSLKTKRKDAEAKLQASDDPAAAVRRHIRLLHEYNEIRDVALNFVGKIAEKERCRTIDVLRDYDMGEKD